MKEQNGFCPSTCQQQSKMTTPQAQNFALSDFYPSAYKGYKGCVAVDTIGTLNKDDCNEGVSTKKHKLTLFVT